MYTCVLCFITNRVVAIYQITLWVGKHRNIGVKPTNSPTQGQLYPRKNRLKVATANIFSWVGIGLYRKQTTRKPTRPNSPQTPYIVNQPIYKTNQYMNQLAIHLANRPTTLPTNIWTNHSPAFGRRTRGRSSLRRPYRNRPEKQKTQTMQQNKKRRGKHKR